MQFMHPTQEQHFEMRLINFSFQQEKLRNIKLNNDGSNILSGESACVCQLLSLRQTFNFQTK